MKKVNKIRSVAVQQMEAPRIFHLVCGQGLTQEEHRDEQHDQTGHRRLRMQPENILGSLLRQVALPMSLHFY